MELATRPVEAPGAAHVTYTTGQEADLPAVVYRPEVQPPGPTAQPSTTAKQSSTSHPSSVVPVEEPAAESDQFSDRASSLADEGEVSDLESTGSDREELLDVDQELTAEQTYRETLRGVRSFMAWNDIPEFDSSSSSQDDKKTRLPAPRVLILGKCQLKSLWTNGYVKRWTNST